MKSPLAWSILIGGVLPLVSAIFFGGGGGGDCGGCQSCCQAQPQCPPPPPCSCASSYAAPQPVADCPPRYIIIRSSSNGGGSVGGGSYSSGPVASNYQPAPVAQSYQSAPAAPQGYQSIPSVGGYQAEQPQQVAAPSPPTESDYTEAAGSTQIEQKSSNYQETAPVQTATETHETYNTEARNYAAKTFNATARCQNPELLELLQSNMVAGDFKESKRRVFKIVNEIFSSEDDKPIDVICAPSKISYRLTVDLSCEYTKGDTDNAVTCVAFKQA
ncbi:hypothetical protein M3Y95_00384900 [Aphelenchoides besseyi]|nr:hypothetical protein M3Y95_00384900 [Aphelenchoides besseyi]